MNPWLHPRTPEWWEGRLRWVCTAPADEIAPLFVAIMQREFWDSRFDW